MEGWIMALNENIPIDGDGVSTGIKVDELAAAIRTLRASLNAGELDQIGLATDVGVGDATPSCKLDVNGAIRSGQSTITTGTHDALDVAGVNSVVCDTTDGHITIGGLANGIAGQIVHLIKVLLANNVIIENNEGTGTQKIYTPDQADITLAEYGGVTLVYDGSGWMVVSE